MATDGRSIFNLVFDKSILNFKTPNKMSTWYSLPFLLFLFYCDLLLFFFMRKSNIGENAKYFRNDI